jgi:hypothetical protein
VSPITLWIATFVLGGGDALLTGVAGVIFGGLFFVLSLPLAVRANRWAVLSGLLTGFGSTWLFLLARASATGGQLDNAAAWTALGVIPLALGLVLLAIWVVRRPSRIGA